MVDRPRIPEVAELQGGLLGDADERVPLLLAQSRLLRAESLGLEQDEPRMGSEPIAQVFS